MALKRSLRPKGRLPRVTKNDLAMYVVQVLEQPSMTFLGQHDSAFRPNHTVILLRLALDSNLKVAGELP